MRNVYFTLLTGLLLLVACNSARKPSDANFTKAINQYLAKHGEVCTTINRQFPIDIPKSQKYAIEAQLSILEQAGLVDTTDTTAVVHGLLDPLQGSGPAQPVKRYELTESGKQYFQQIPGGVFGKTTQFCYGQKSVDTILKWTEPETTGVQSQTEVTYTYKIVNLAAWAQRPDVQKVYPDIGATISGAARTPEIAGLQLTNKGWEVPEQ